jgi:hypothetical protein
MKYTIVITYTFSNAWLALSRDERNAIETKTIGPIFGKYADRVQARFFDAEAFHTKFSDFMILETQDLRSYYFLMEEMRDSVLLAQGYVVFNDILIGLENGYREFEEQALADKG